MLCRFMMASHFATISVAIMCSCRWSGDDRSHLGLWWAAGALDQRLVLVASAAPATLTVVPGSVIKIETDSYISANAGNLKARGTPDAPIIFTSVHDDTVGGDSNANGDATLPEPGNWESTLSLVKRFRTCQCRSSLRRFDRRSEQRQQRRCDRDQCQSIAAQCSHLR